MAKRLNRVQLEEVRTRGGYVTHGYNAVNDGLVVLYRAAEAGLDPAGGPWVTSCEVHGTLCNHETRQLAEDHLRLVNWCEACMGPVG